MIPAESHPWRIANNAMMREDRGPRRFCACGRALPQRTSGSGGRNRVWCSTRCRDRAYRRREPTVERVEVATVRLREAFSRSGMSKCELARRMGWMKVVPNLYRLDVTLGLVPSSNTGRRRKSVTYAMGVRLARAMNADLLEVGV